MAILSSSMLAAELQDGFASEYRISVDANQPLSAKWTRKYN
jgi:hypothetical protein